MPMMAGNTQMRECKRAFYAGAHGLFEAAIHGASTKPEDEAEQLLKDIQKDAELFCEEVMKGKA